MIYVLWVSFILDREEKERQKSGKSSFAAIICHSVIEFVACLTGTSAAGSQTALRKMVKIDLTPECRDKSPKVMAPILF